LKEKVETPTEYDININRFKSNIFWKFKRWNVSVGDKLKPLLWFSRRTYTYDPIEYSSMASYFHYHSPQSFLIFETEMYSMLEEAIGDAKK